MDIATALILDDKLLAFASKLNVISWHYILYYIKILNPINILLVVSILFQQNIILLNNHWLVKL